MADEAIQYMKQLKEIAPDKPFFVYYVPGGTHAPHHPTPESVRRSVTCISSIRVRTAAARPSSPTRSGWALCPKTRS